MIPESFVQELLARVDIVDLIERHVPLKKGGANYAACCPFHNEKSPSFTVSPSKQFYHCFGCGAHGTAIGFLMEYAGMSFPETVRELAGMVGLTVPEDSAPPKDRARSTSLLAIMETASRFYRDQLKTSPQAIDYLKGRGLTGEIAARFQIGYAPEDWQALQQVFPRYDDPALVEAGLVIVNETGRRYDRFRERVMFPIHDQRGNIIGFGGRVLGKGEPKYLNSPETPLFEKGRELYGLHQARQSLRESGTVVVTEGYMDVVALAQSGFPNAVATLGTATTGTHIQKMMRQVERIVFCFDGDAAGRKAARRALDNSLEFLADDHALSFLFLPAEHDPDSFVRENGLEAFRRAVATAMPLTEFLLRELRGDLDLTTAEGRARLIHEAKEAIPRIPAELLRVQIVRQLAQDAQMDVGEVERALGLRSTPRGKQAPKRAPRAAVLGVLPQLLRLVAGSPDLLGKLPADIIGLCGEGPETVVLQALLDAHDNATVTSHSLVAMFERFRDSPQEPVLADMLRDRADGEISVEVAAATLDGLLRNLQRAALDHEFQQLHQRLGQGDALDDEEMQRFARLPIEIQKLRTGHTT